MRLVCYNTWPEVMALREAWNPLLTSSQSDSVFLTWEWLEAWWKNYGLDRQLAVIGGWHAGELVGIAPFYIDSVRRWGMRSKCLRLVGDGSGDSDYLDCIIRAGREQEFVEVLLDYWEQDDAGWDYAEWHGPKRESPCLHALLHCARQRSWKQVVEDIPCATLQLPSDWSTYLQTLKPRFRSKLRAALAFFDAQPGVVTRECAVSEEIPEWLSDLFHLHTARWSRRGLPGVFRSDTKQRFYGDITRVALEKGWLAFHRLDWGDRPLALQYGFLYANRFYLLQEGYDPDFEAFRPGIALRGWLMRHWVQQGLTEYDFLAGAAHNKLDWAAELRLSTRVRVAPVSRRRGRLLSLSEFEENFKADLSSLIPSKLRDIRRNFHARRSRRLVQTTSGAPPDGHTNALARVLHIPQAATTVLRAVATQYRIGMQSGPWYHRVHRATAPECQILIYHRVNDDGDPFFPALPSDTFRRQMEYLAHDFTLVSLDQIAAREWQPLDGKPCVAVTFDDGYRDNLLYAYPILNQLRIPATIYLATGYIETGDIPWYERVSLALKLTRVDELELTEIGGPHARLASCQDRLRARADCITWLRAVTDEQRALGLETLFKALHVPDKLRMPNLMLTWSDVRHMAKGGISMGAHTVRHPVMSRIRREEADREVRLSKEIVEKHMQIEVQHFAYPFGQPADFTEESKQAVRAAGLVSAVTTVWGFNLPDQDLFELRRFTPWESDPAMFALKLNWYRFFGVRPQPAPATRAATAPVAQR